MVRVVKHFRPGGAAGEVDPGITYPSYKAFDEFIDVERLKSLDKDLVERVTRYAVRGGGDPFHTGPYRLYPFGKRRPESRVIPLSESPDAGYFIIDKPGNWGCSKEAGEFVELMDFIATLPFESTGRMVIMFDEVGRSVPPHRDHTVTDTLHEFIWFRTNLAKPFYLFDWKSKKKKYVKSYSAWFDTVNQYHGADAVDAPSISIRVDGRFTDEFRAKIPRPAINPASTPSLWASTPT